MSLKQVVSYPTAEWSGILAGGVAALFNGRELPWKYEPESQNVKPFGMLNPDVDLTTAPTNNSSPSNLNGTYLYAYVEVDSLAQGPANEGQLSGPPKSSVGVEAVVVDGFVTLTLPLTPVNAHATELWIYRTLAGGAWPTLGRIATVDIGTETYVDTGDTPDFTNYPLNIYRAPAPAQTYPAKMNRRLLTWGNEPFTTTIRFETDSATAEYVSGDVLDDGAIGAVIYPDDDTQGYPISNFVGGSPGTITLDKTYERALGSPNAAEISCRICHPAGAVRWSEPGDYENFPAANIRYVERAAADPESGIGIINGNALLFTVGKTFRLFFNVTPDVGDGQIQELSTTIGCLAHRSIQDVDGMLIWLTSGGIAVSNGGIPQIISDEIAPKFDEIIRDSDGRVRTAFAVNWQDQRRYMLFYPRSTDTEGCSAAIVVDYRQVPGEPRFRFTFYTFEQEFRAGSIERHTSVSAGVTNYPTYPVLVDRYGFSWSFGIGDADGPQTGTVSGTVTSASTSPPTFTDSSASFRTAGLGLNGVAVTFRRRSDGQEQTLIVSTTQSDTLSLRDAWDGWVPQSGDSYWVGQIDSFYETGDAPLGAIDRPKELDRLVVASEIQSTGELTADVYINQESSVQTFPNEGNTLDMTDGRQIVNLSGLRAFLVKLRFHNNRPNQPWKLRAAQINFEGDEP